ncbi:sugar phosphate isomerase/epimerase [Paenibacillus sediminis]|uniref:Sugar phosphate isomerase/epimerase n=1 Tax=Paenibacillus sediminis TaxID=664909 RepID=A0ABS4H0R9_9BACL|nr:sugar phosphate isomerase/epimerase [Paenibacillus sediminis]MBP1936120.1 sugar phosphate isomerase/epimerase [Paenibacillus sediminis]
MNKFPVAVQPYTVREALVKDYIGTLERIAQIGYQGIELGCPPEGMAISEQKAILDRLGLRVIGTHAGFDTLDFDPDLISDYLDEVNGGRYVAVSLRFNSKEDVLIKAEKMNVIGAKFRKRGVQFLYHNHNWEFVRYDGEYALDILLRETDPAFVQMELDTYWVKRGGEEPTEYLSKLKNRCPLLHIKDVEDGEDQFFAEIGEGILDFKAIARAAEEVGTKWLIVEQDQSRRDPFESLAISYRNLKEMGLI